MLLLLSVCIAHVHADSGFDGSYDVGSIGGASSWSSSDYYHYSSGKQVFLIQIQNIY